jgi:hypothetical protein
LFLIEDWRLRRGLAKSIFNLDDTLFPEQTKRQLNILFERVGSILLMTGQRCGDRRGQHNEPIFVAGDVGRYHFHVSVVSADHQAGLRHWATPQLYTGVINPSAADKPVFVAVVH